MLSQLPRLFELSVCYFFMFLLCLYKRFISPFTPRSCRFYPSCSQYSMDALQRYGIRGIWLTMIRLGKCHPLSKGGYDPLP